MSVSGGWLFLNSRLQNVFKLRRQRVKDEDFEKAVDEQLPPGPGKYIEGAIAYFFGLLLVALFVWLWWQGESNSPMEQVKELINKNK